jgi:cell division protein FtsQ
MRGTRELERAADIDPRIRARRDEVARARIGRILRVARWTLIAAAVPALLFALTRSPGLDVDRIVVGGAHRTGVRAVAQASGVEFGDPLTDVDLQEAARRIERMPWVLDAVVERDLPDTVRIVVTERVAVAAARPSGAEAGTAFALLDDTGHVVGHATSPIGLPVVDVLDELPSPGTRLDASTAQVLAVAAALPPELGSEVGRLWAEDGSVVLTRRAGGTVRLGSADDLEEKVRALRTITAKVDLSCLDVLDLRVPSAPVVTRTDPCP